MKFSLYSTLTVITLILTLTLSGCGTLKRLNPLDEHADNLSKLPGTAAPVLSLTAGTYTGTQNISITCSDPKAMIFYTTDGITPNQKSNQYTLPICCSRTMTLKAVAMNLGSNFSSITSAVYTILDCVVTPVISPDSGTYSTSQMINIVCNTPGAKIYYTTDGSMPTAGSSLYITPFTLPASATVKAIAIKTGVKNSTVASNSYNYQVGMPEVSPQSGTYFTDQAVSIACVTPGSILYFTIDGTTPTTASYRYTNPILVTKNSTLRALAVKSGFSNSQIAVNDYVLQVKTPVISPQSGTYSAVQTISMSCETPGASIYYTMDGSSPTTQSNKYQSPFTLPASATIQAIADKLGYNTSSAVTNVFLCNYVYHLMTVGVAGFSAGNAWATDIAIDSKGTPYVVYSDLANRGKATVMKFNGSSWENVGAAGFSKGEASFTSIAIDGSGTPFVVYIDLEKSSKTTVMKFDGSNWVTVGTAGFSAGTVECTDIAIDSNGIPYVVYPDVANKYKATVKKFNGSSWVTVGTAGFSNGGAFYTKIAIDSDTPYVVYRGSGLQATVNKFNGSSWVTVGTEGFSEGWVQDTDIAIDSRGVPYVVYSDSENHNKATVMKFNGSSWVTVGTAGFTDWGVSETKIAIDFSGIPYVVYCDQGWYQYKPTLKRFNGKSWATVVTEGFSAGTAQNASIAIDGSGTPYVIYTDYGNSGKATVIKFMP